MIDAKVFITLYGIALILYLASAVFHYNNSFLGKVLVSFASNYILILMNIHAVYIVIYKLSADDTLGTLSIIVVIYLVNEFFSWVFKDQRSWFNRSLKLYTLCYIWYNSITKRKRGTILWKKTI